MTDSIASAVQDSQFATSEDDQNAEAKKKEANEVKALWQEYETARKFDGRVRGQYAIDRRYAAGTADPTWAVDTNLIGSYIDVLVSFLYARDPDVSVRKAPQVDNSGSKDMEDFAKTLELVISRLWKKARLKHAIRRQVRSTLSTGPGWIKAIVVADGPNVPQMITDLNDARVQIAELQAAKSSLQEGKTDDAQPYDETEKDAELANVQELIDTLTSKIEATIRKFLAVDFVASQDHQVSLDVSTISEYLEADWNANAIYIPKKDMKAKFPGLQDKEVNQATIYFQRQTKDLQPLTDQQGLNDNVGGIRGESAEQYVTGSGNSGNSADENGIEFVKVVELWDKRTLHIKTMIDGVKKWAKPPYKPDYPSSRFYPYFLIAFYEVDGSRHPQSLSWRLKKLQDEYARSRSNFRITRERSIPGTLFNASGVSPDDARKIQSSTHQELIGITPTNPDAPINNLFAAKPVSPVDGRLFDNGPILADMEKISGVQEALQSSASSPKTATEANIQQTGFASRTTADRDTLEDMLTDLANYTAEQAIGALNHKDVVRIAGPKAFWPEGMDTEDLFTLVEVEITAGSTGKPKDSGDRQAWGVVLPAIKEAIASINDAIASGNLELAHAIGELVKETMKRFGDVTDPERFLPKIPDQLPPPPPPIPPPPKVSISLKGDLPPAMIPAIAAESMAPPPAPPPGTVPLSPGSTPLPSSDTSGVDPTAPIGPQPVG